MLSKKLAALAAALSLMTASTAASAQAPQFTDSVAVRSGESTADANELTGGWMIAALVVVALLIGVVILTEDSDSP